MVTCSPDSDRTRSRWARVCSLMRLAWSSGAALAIAPLQDLLNLGPEARMNVPGRPEGNWAWRFRDGALTDELRRLNGTPREMLENPEQLLFGKDPVKTLLQL